jgi:hypothetical protein
LSQLISGQTTNARRIAKIQERFDALPLDVQQEIIRLREPHPHHETRSTLNIGSSMTQHINQRINPSDEHFEAA